MNLTSGGTNKNGKILQDDGSQLKQLTGGNNRSRGLSIQGVPTEFGSGWQAMDNLRRLPGWVSSANMVAH